MLEAKNIHKVYSDVKKPLPVLKGVSLIVKRGEFVSIVGPSGAGKSTLLHILGGLDSPSSGTIRIEDEDIYSLSDAQLALLRNTRIGFVFQFYHLLSELTVIENVLLPGLIRGGNREVLSKKALDLLHQTGLKARVNHFPSQLSGGEKQRVAVVRSLINEPGLLLCDEPTGNLDSKSGEDVFSLIKNISRINNMAVVLVTHNLELAKTAEKIYHLADGLLTH